MNVSRDVFENVSGSPAVRTFAAIAGFTLATFALAIILEDAIAATGARADATLAEIAAQERILRLPAALNQTSRAIESRIADLHLSISERLQATMLIGELERLAARYGLRVMVVRRAGLIAPDPRAGASHFERGPYEIVVEGAYPRVLEAIVALCRVPLVTQVPLVTFERLRDGSTFGDVRASLEIQLFRLRE